MSGSASSDLPPWWRRRPRKPSPGHGTVYIIVADTGWLKIGVSNDPHKRLLALQTASSAALRLAKVFEFPPGYCFKIERRAHRALRHVSARRGEWFYVKPAVAEEAVQKAAEEVGLLPGRSSGL